MFDDRLERREFVCAVGSVIASLAGLTEVASLKPLRGPRAPSLDKRTFNILVLGDSVMWGEGLEDNQKFSTLVQQWVQKQLPPSYGMAVRLEVFAHSGAVIAPDGNDGKPAKPSELATGAPSITKQVELARDRMHQLKIGLDQVDLVLMNGGINDVGVPNNLFSINPNISSATSAARIATLTQQVAVTPMETLLSSVVSMFPGATIVLTGYYPIVSEQTNADAMYSWVNMIGLLPPFLIAKIVFLKEWLSWLHDRWQQNCNAFDKAIRDGQKGIVAKVNTQLHATDPRIVFVTVPFAPKNCYGTDPGDTWLWTFGDQTFAGGVAEKRRRDCVADGRTGPDLQFCSEGEAAHPNITGAKKYADAIIAALTPFVPRWRAQFAPPPARTMTVRIDPMPTIVLDKEDTMRVFASDRATGAEISTGQVFLGLDGPYALGSEIRHTICRLYKAHVVGNIHIPAKIECDSRVTVKASGYADQVLMLAIPQAILDLIEPEVSPGPP